MASRAANAFPEMGCMFELNVSAGGKAVYAHPRNFEVLIRIFDDLLNLRPIGQQLGMAENALADGRDSSTCPSIGANVAIDTAHPKLHVLVMRKGNGLLRRPSDGGKQR